MLYADGALGLLVLGFWLYCLLDVITTDESQMRNLPKTAWLLIVILLFDIGALAWVIAGRPRSWQRPAPGTAGGGIPSEYDRPGRAAAQNPEDDAAFLAQLKARAEHQRKLAEEQARRIREQEDRPPTQ